METTFGKTVETRLIHSNIPSNDNIAGHFKSNQQQSHSNGAEVNYNSLDFNSLKKSTQLKQQMQRQKQLQHIYLNRYKEMHDPTGILHSNQHQYQQPTTPLGSSYGVPCQQQPLSAILTRKNFKHLLNAPVKCSLNGYSSDGGDYSYVAPSRKSNQLNNPQLKFKKINTSLSNEYNSDCNQTWVFFTYFFFN